MLGYNSVRFKNLRLYKGTEDTKYAVVPSNWEIFGDPSMWRVKYPDGSRSEDHYNRTRAKQHCIEEYLHDYNGREKPLEGR